MSRKIRDIADAKIVEALSRAGGVVGFAARLLGVSRQALVRRVEACPDLRDDWRDPDDLRAEGHLRRMLLGLRSGETGANRWWLENVGDSEFRTPHRQLGQALDVNEISKLNEAHCKLWRQQHRG